LYRSPNRSVRKINASQSLQRRTSSLTLWSEVKHSVISPKSAPATRPLGETEHVNAADDADLGGPHWVDWYMERRRRAGEVVGFIDLCLLENVTS
jgi:hypothetical protein